MGLRKLQIFLSSTYTDLVDLRLSAIEAILAAGHIPATMEQFVPGDETALEIIRRWIADSDAFILMLGGRLGSIEPISGKSYVQLEYELAVELHKPLFAMVISDRALQERVEKLGLEVADERKNQTQYGNFKETVQLKLCSYFSDAKDIRSTIFQKLPEWAQRGDLVGWVRASDAISARTAEELSRLSSENASLRAAAKSSIEMYDGVTFEQLVGILKDDFIPGALAVKLPDKVTHAGLLFDNHLERLAPGLKLQNMPEFQATHQAMRILIGHGLISVQHLSGAQNYELTPTGRRFRNSLLAFGSRDRRFKELWGV